LIESRFRERKGAKKRKDSNRKEGKEKHFFKDLKKKTEKGGGLNEVPQKLT